MANITKIYDIKLQGEKELVTQMQKVNKQFDDAKKRFKDLKTIISAGGLSSGDLSKYTLEMQQAKLETEKLRQESTRLTNEGKAQTNALRTQREEQRKNREETKLSLTEYQLLSKKLNELRNNAKEVGIVFGLESQEFKQAALAANKLDKELKAIDASLGQFQRNVGNYPKEINIGGVSSGVISQLQNAGLGDVLGNQVDQTKGKVIQLNSEFARLKAELEQARASGTTDLNAIETGLINNRIEAERLNIEIENSQTHLAGMGSVGTGVFGTMGTDIKNMILGYVGLQAAMSGVQQLITGTKELSDTTTNLEIELGGTSETAGLLVENLGKLDTRTKLTSLAEIANIATKAGTSEENLIGVTEAIDKVKVSFGKDFGDIETGTETFAKLINVFYEDREITGDRILKIGNSIRTLANETVASVPYINDFNGRMAGLRQIFTNFELSDSIGLGAGFEEFKQSAEVSSTALVKILPKLAADTEKFAKILGIPQAEFKKLINKNPAEALIQVSEKLVKSGKGVEEIATSFADAELGAGRVTTILGTLGGKADVFRERIARAKNTINDTANINEAFAKKNENLAGVLDKVSKKFTDLANNKTFINLVSITGTAILGLITIITSIPFGWWIGMLAYLTLAYWSNIAAVYASITATGNKILVKIYENALTAAGNALIVTGTILEYAQAIATGVLTAAKWLLVASMNALGISTVGLRGALTLLNTTFLSTPLGWVLLGILAIGAATSAYASQVDNTTKSLKKQGEQLKLTASQNRVNAEIEKRAGESTSERIAKLKVLTQIASNLNNSDVGRKKAMEELIAIDKDYATAMDGNIIRIDKLRLLTDKLTASILLQAKAEAAKNLLVEKQKKIIENKLKQDELRPEADKLDTRLNKNIGFLQGTKAFAQSVGKSIGIGDGTASDQLIDLYQQNLKLQEDVDTLAGIVAKDTTDNSKNKNPNGVPPTNPDGGTPGGGDGTPKQVKDYLRDINALREAELSELKKTKLEGSITEEQFLVKSLAVNIKYNDKILNHFKGTDATTRKLRADTASDSIDKKIETNAKLFKLQEDELNQTLSNDKAISQSKLDDVNSDPYTSNLDKVQAEQQFYETLLNLQVDFNTKMDLLENKFKQDSKKNAEDRKNLILKEQSDLKKKQFQLSKVQFDSLITGVEDFKTYRKNNAEIEASKQRMIILNNKSLSQKQKEYEIDKINAALSLAITNIELGAIDAQIKFYDDRIAKQRLTNDEQKTYNDLLRQRQLLLEGKATGEEEVKKKGAVKLALPSDSNTQNVINDKLTQSLGLSERESALLGQAIAQSFDLANQAMSSYFDGERQAVEQSKQLAYQRIDLEKKQLLAKAQSQNERDSIEKQAATKKALADKQAHEKLKKIKKQELTIAFALQLANIAVAAASNPTNGVTFGASGAIMYGILAAIATAGYALNMANVDKQQFKKGGKLPTKGGPFIGSSHADGGIPVGMNEFEGDELAIINKRSAKSNEVFSVTGTTNQIASKLNAIGGGVDWAGGASLTKFMRGGAFLGSSVQPPVFRSYYEGRGLNQKEANSNELLDIAGLHNSILELRNVVESESRKKVVLNPNEVRDYEREKNKQSEIATL